MEKSVVSVVIPVYKVEAYLSECIDSILSQTYQELEILLIDDGSPDNCGVICDRYADKDDRIRVIHQENKGLSAARNVGIENARGQYITFVDSDDVCAREMIEKLYLMCKKYQCEIAQCTPLDFSDKQEYECKKYQNEEHISIYNNREICNKLFDLNQKGFIPAQNKIYERRLFDDIKFPLGKIHEDEYTTYKLYWKASKIAVTDCQLYYYRKNNAGSIMNAEFSLKRLDALGAFKERTEFFKEKEENKLYTKALLLYFNSVLRFIAIMSKKKYENEYKNICRKLERENRKNAATLMKLPYLDIKEKIRILFAKQFPHIYIWLRRIE